MSVYVDTDIYNEDVPKGIVKQGVLVFEVPDNASCIELDYLELEEEIMQGTMTIELPEYSN